MKYARVALLLALLFLAGCGDTCSDMAFPGTGLVTRIEVSSRDGAIQPRQITDPDQIRRILEFAKARQTHWRAPWYGVPGGDLRVGMFCESTFLANFDVGAGFFAAQGCGYFYIRSASAAEIEEYLKLLSVEYELS